MPKKFIRTLCLAAALCLLFSALLVSCSNKDGNGTTTTASPGTTAPDNGNEGGTTTDSTPPEDLTPSQQVAVDIPEENLDYTFKIRAYIRDNHPLDPFGGNGMSSGDTLNDAVYRRNSAIESRYGIFIESTAQSGSY